MLACKQSYTVIPIRARIAKTYIKNLKLEWTMPKGVEEIKLIQNAKEYVG